MKKITKKELKRLEKKETNKKDKLWREAIKLRDSNECVICGSTNYVHTHHIIPRELKEYRWNVDNGICLCAKHHKFNREISAHANPLEFVLWLQKNRKAQLKRLK